ncbi:MAG: copper-containing nitrite reductase [Ignavibacteriaceae bacterium]
MKKLFNIKSFSIITNLSIVVILCVVIIQGCEDTNKIDGTEFAKLCYAPDVPSPILRDHPTKVIVNLEAKQVVGRLADEVEYPFWTFGGKVPGEFIRVKEGDLVEFHLHNSPTSTMPHSIDLHAVLGPGGGAVASETLPGHTSVFSFKAMHAGLYIYHCATQPVPMHIANGMYGLILVEPKDGLPHVDKEYYVMQSEFYTVNDYGSPGLQQFSMEKALAENPTYVVFNGSVGSLTGSNALQARVGDKIRLFVGNIGPNKISSFHIIGEIFDKVYDYGGAEVTQRNVQTVLIPAGGAVVVEFTAKVPGTFLLVDHSIFRAFNKGALGMLKVTGDERKDIFSGKQADKLFTGSQADANSGPIDNTNLVSPTVNENTSSINENDIQAVIEKGKEVFSRTCIACHQINGEGIPGVFPPLAESDFLNADKERAIGIVLHGKTGPVTIKGKSFNGVMPPQNLSDQEIAAVLTYVYNSFGNSKKFVKSGEVTKIRNNQ